MNRTPGILLVEDHGPTRQTVARALREAGFLVYDARDGATARELMERHRPEVIIQDLMLPDVDGFVLANELRALAGADPVRIFAFSGMVSNLDARKIAETGFDDVIVKPILPSRLIELVRAHVSAESVTRGRALQALHELSDPLAPRGEGLPAASNSQEGEGELLRRCSSLSAELAVMRALTQSVLQHGDVETALLAALSTCFDASQSAFGALYLCDHGQLRTCLLGSERNVDLASLRTFFGHERWLREAMEHGVQTLEHAPVEVRVALANAGVEHAMMVPLTHAGGVLGALFMVAQENAPSVRRFAQAIAEQVSYTLALAELFRAREKAERESEQQRRLARDQASMWRALVDGAPDVVMHVDAQGRVRFINRAPAGTRSGRGGPLSWFDMFEPEYHQEMRRALASVFEHGSAHTLETTQRGSDDNQTWTDIHIGPVRNGSEVTGAMVIQRDVSEKRLAEAQLIVADRMASVGSLASAIAHEVNNPLASVLANLELAVRDAEEMGARAPGELIEELHDAREAATRVRGIVRDLNVFSRGNDDSFGPVDLERVLDSVLRLAWNEVRPRATLSREFRATPRVHGNEGRLGQALLSLVLHAANGIEEGDPEHNTISVQLYADELGQVIVNVRDTGPSLAEATRASMLKPFSSSRPPAGDSIGLSICQRVLSEHGGSLSVVGINGRGNELRVSLPACDEQPLADHEEPRSEVRALRRGRVLVIDDERLITQVVRRTLAREHEVVTLDNATEALRRLDAGEVFDAIVCDLIMPGMSGMEFHRRVVSAHPELAERIVFFTGGAFTPRAREFLRRVPNQRVDKPVAGYELRAVINAMVR